MRYLKRFNESVDLESQLRDFSESYLAYLLDDGYTVNITQASDHSGGGGLPPNAFLIKLSNDIDFTWLDVKESYIPFLHMLNRDYNIVDQSIMIYDYNDDTEFGIETILSGNPLPFDNESLIEILVWVTFDKPIKESVELKTDDIEHYLAYLIDEDFEVKSIIKGGGFSGVQPQQSISMERKLTQEEWRDILMTGLTTKSVIIGVKSAPMRVYYSDRFKPAVTLSNYKCEMLDQIESLAQDCADKLLLSLSDQFSSTKIIMSFKVGPGHVQQYNFGDISIRLQIILIE
jgi:hypothetical protein